jgi:hypothetical protein
VKSSLHKREKENGGGEVKEAVDDAKGVYVERMLNKGKKRRKKEEGKGLMVGGKVTY